MADGQEQILIPYPDVFKDYRIKFEKEVRNCEDIILDEARGAAILSCDAGRDRWNTVMVCGIALLLPSYNFLCTFGFWCPPILHLLKGVFIDPSWSGALYYYKYPKYPNISDTGAIHLLQINGMPVESWMKFHPLGLGYWAPSRTLFVVNHGPPGPSIEIFKINKQVTAASHMSTIQHELLNSPNSVVPISETELLVTNDHKWTARRNSTLNLLESYLAYPGGNVVYMNLETNETKVLAHLPFANGITLLNKTMLAVASTTTPSINIYNLTRSETSSKTHNKAPTLKLIQKISVPFFPDNLGTDSDGKLLIAGHPHPPALERVAKTNHRYFGDEQDGWIEGKLPEARLPADERPRSPSWVVEWNGNQKGVMRDIYLGTEYGTSSSFARDVGRGVAFIVGLYERGIFVGKV
jgi:arylesterase/paraoxonase